MLQNTPEVYVGIDVAKRTLAVDLCGRIKECPNTAEGLADLLSWLRELDKPSQVVCEASGGYERLLVRALHAVRVPVTIVSGARIRKYAEGCGVLAKTDRIDSRILSQYGRERRPQPTAATSEQEQRMVDLVRRRKQLTAYLAEEKTHRQEMVDPVVIEQIEYNIRSLKDQIRSLEQKVLQIIEADPTLHAKQQTLCSVCGVGTVIAAELLSEMPELGTIGRQKVASLAGVAPFPRDTGLSSKTRHIRKGRFYARRALYMAALTAARANPVLKGVYRRLRDRGKTHRVAIVAVMRRLLIYLNSLIANLRPALDVQHS